MHHFFVVVSMAVVAITQASSAPPTPAAEINCSRLRDDDRSLLSTLLTVTGFSDTCVAAALDVCTNAGQGQDSRNAYLTEKAMDVAQQVSVAVLKQWESRPRHCKDLLDSGDSGSGLRQVYPYPGQPHRRVTVFCDHTVDGGGWTVFQRRSSEVVRQNFTRSWIEYQLGFGDLEGEFWLGLDLLHQLTSTSLQQLRIDLEDYEGEHRWAKYGFFHVGEPTTKFLLSVGSYSGNAGDSFAEKHNGMPFSTYDADHDKHSSWNCAERRFGGYWFKACYDSNLNGHQYVGDNTHDNAGISWRHWRGVAYSLKEVSMKMRPAH